MLAQASIQCAAGAHCLTICAIGTVDAGLRQHDKEE
jgi:hypothetical protein